MIELKGLKKKYDDAYVLKGINYTFKEGKTVAIIGSSGSGKSTLLRCINHLVDFDEGAVIFKGELLTKKNIHKHRKDIQMVFQDFHLFTSMNVLKNITYAQEKVLHRSKKAAVEKAMELLELVGLQHKKDARVFNLSGGQKQRIAIARSLAMDPEVLLFDEPTSSLDPEMVSDVLDVIKKLSSKGYTSIIVTHEMGFAKEVSDEIVFMDEGEIVESGNTQSFFNSPKTKRAELFLQKILK
jgi:polar amino acid transport system ATP-binding protein